MSSFDYQEAMRTIANLARKALTDAYQLDDPYSAALIECQELSKILAIANTGANAKGCL